MYSNTVAWRPAVSCETGVNKALLTISIMFSRGLSVGRVKVVLEFGDHLVGACLFCVHHQTVHAIPFANER